MITFLFNGVKGELSLMSFSEDVIILELISV